MTALARRGDVPPGFLEVSARDLHELLPQPTLIHLSGERAQALFVAILQHGNEDTGLRAVQALLREYHARALPRDLLLFVANVRAAHAGVRQLDDQTDYNRAWPGTEAQPCAETRLMQQVMAAAAAFELFAAIDVHNNTGSNPHYAAINRLDRRFVQLGRLFSNTIVHFERPRGVMTQAFSSYCPAVVLECGKVGNLAGVQHARTFIDACLNIERIPEDRLGANEVDLFHTVAQVKLREHASFGFGTPDRALNLSPVIDAHNFQPLPAGAVLGDLRTPVEEQLLVLNEAGEDVTARFLLAEGGKLRLRTEVMPSMLTRDERVVAQDCLCYFMERIGGEML